MSPWAHRTDALHGHRANALPRRKTDRAVVGHPVYGRRAANAAVIIATARLRLRATVGIAIPGLAVHDGAANARRTYARRIHRHLFLDRRSIDAMIGVRVLLAVSGANVLGVDRQAAVFAQVAAVRVDTPRGLGRGWSPGGVDDRRLLNLPGFLHWNRLDHLDPQRIVDAAS